MVCNLQIIHESRAKLSKNKKQDILKESYTND